MARLEDYFDCRFLGITINTVPTKALGIGSGKKLVIASGAKCVWDDLFNLGVMGDENSGWDVLCVNDIVMHYPGRVDHLFSNDKDLVPYWLGARRRQYRKKWSDPIVHSLGTHKPCVNHTWPWPGQGTSMLGAVYTGCAMGYDPIVICGGPLDNGPHYFDPDWVRSNFVNEVPDRNNGGLAIWGSARGALKGRVFSMSGRTKELLGAP